MERFVGIIGIVVIFLICYALSNNRKAINYKTVGMGFILQIALALFIFKIPIGQKMFMLIGAFIRKILEFAYEYASKNNNLLLVARNENKLIEIKKNLQVKSYIF